jgi:hypothetical protein
MAQKPPVIVTARKPRPRTPPKAKAEATPLPTRIVTARKPGSRVPPPDLSPEEVNRRRDASVEIWRELVRRAMGKKKGAPARGDGRA